MVEAGAEGGLLGLALHPDYAHNGFIYLYYMTPIRLGYPAPYRTVVTRYTRSETNPRTADPGSLTVILDIPQPFRGHNGGQLAFGPDGMLYLSLGDGGVVSPAWPNSQDRTNLLGSVLRIDVDNPDPGRRYGIPPDNPFVGNPHGWREEIYAFGFRNPWRFSFDAPTGRLWLGDVGHLTWEEINLVEPGGNFGWPAMEGPDCFDPPEGCDPTAFVPAVHAYDRTQGFSVTGGVVYRGSGLPELVGRYLFADFIAGRIWALDYDDDGSGSVSLVHQPTGAPPLITTFGLDAEGEVLVAALHRPLFRLRRPVPPSTESPPPGPGGTALQIYPNPFRERLSVELGSISSGPVRVVLTDLLGRTVLERLSGVADGAGWVTLDTSRLPAGSYVVSVETDGTTRTRRVVRTR
jgi:hypothetical protein